MIPLARNIKRYFSLREIAVVFMAVVISVSAGIGVFICLKKDVVIDDNGKQTVVKTMKTTVSEVLEQNGIDIRPEDYVSVSPDSRLQAFKDNKVRIIRAVPVDIIVDGSTNKILTYRSSVSEALENSPFKMSGKDRLEGVKPGDRIRPGMSIRIVRVREKTLKQEIPIQYKVVRSENDRLDNGVERVLREGKNGMREKLFKVVLEDGKETVRTLLKDCITLNPINKLVEFGTVLNYKTSRGDLIRYSKVLNMRATAYTSSYADTGKRPGDKGFGITYTGVRAKKGIIAVDPRVISLGTRVYIEMPGSVPDYGYAIAADIGGAVKGNLIDLYFDDQKSVSNWGCKRVTVYVLQRY